MSGSLFSVRELSFHYRSGPWFRKRSALDGVSLEGERGEIHGLLGGNGAGKSTLLRHLAGLIPSSRVVVLGRPAGDVAVRSEVAYLPEARDLSSRITVREALELQATLYGFRGGRRGERVAEALAEVGLEERAKQRLTALSHGQRRRVAVAMALIPEARLLLLDEPLGGVDPIWSDRIRGLLKERASQGTGIVLSSHQLADMDGLCSRLSVLHEGRLLASGSIDFVLGEPAAWQALVSAADPARLPTSEQVRAALAALAGTEVEVRRARRRLADVLLRSPERRVDS